MALQSAIRPQLALNLCLIHITITTHYNVTTQHFDIPTTIQRGVNV
jgi:hypothetical protein